MLGAAPDQVFGLSLQHIFGEGLGLRVLGFRFSVCQGLRV